VTLSRSIFALDIDHWNRNDAWRGRWNGRKLEATRRSRFVKTWNRVSIDFSRERIKARTDKISELHEPRSKSRNNRIARNYKNESIWKSIFLSD